MTITPVVIEADYTLIGINTAVKYDLNRSGLAAGDVQSAIIAAMDTYNTASLHKFNARFRYSQLLAAIDDANAAIADNQTETTMIKRLIPSINENYSLALRYQNQLTPGSITSTAFTFGGLQCSIIDDSNGNLKIISTVEGIQTPLIIIGTVNYATGIVNVINLNVSEYVGNYISIFATPTNYDVNSSQNVIMEIDFDNVAVSVEGIRI
jgi:hypothetical protein